MAVSVPTRFFLRLLAFAEEVGLFLPVKADTLLTLLRNATFVYATCGRSRVLHRAWYSGRLVVQPSGSARLLVVEATAELGESRKVLEWRVDSEECDVLLQVWDSTRTLVLAGPTAFTTAGRNLNTGSWTLVTAAQQVLVEVEVRKRAGTDGKLYHVDVTEGSVLLADLPG